MKGSGEQRTVDVADNVVKLDMGLDVFASFVAERGDKGRALKTDGVLFSRRVEAHDACWCWLLVGCGEVKIVVEG